MSPQYKWLLMWYTRRSEAELLCVSRVSTVTVTVQVGCAQNCQFCYTGRMGLLGNLTTAQIVEQARSPGWHVGAAQIPLPPLHVHPPPTSLDCQLT